MNEPECYVVIGRHPGQRDVEVVGCYISRSQAQKVARIRARKNPPAPGQPAPCFEVYEAYDNSTRCVGRLTFSDLPPALQRGVCTAAEPKSLPMSVRDRPKPRRKIWSGQLAGSLFAAVGLLICLWFAQVAWQSWQSRDWPSVPGVIASSYSVSHTDGRGRSHSHPRIHYDYSVAGEAFVGERVRFGGMNTGQALSVYPAEALVTVYYHPEHPEQVVLSRGLDQYDWALLILGLVMVVIGVTVVRDNR